MNFDDFSKPVPAGGNERSGWIFWRTWDLDHHDQRGEPLMHPDLDDVIRHIRRRGMIAGLITNGFYLNKERIERLNEAGLEHVQISIDNVAPDGVSKKSLKTLVWPASDAVAVRGVPGEYQLGAGQRS